MRTRFGTLAYGLIVTISLIGAAQLHAQSWFPTRAVRWIVPYPPGGANDLVTRTVAEPLSAATGQQFVIDNRGGASSTIGLDLMARATPDGYTIATAADSLTILPSSFKTLSFDPRTSFVPVTNMTRQPMALTVFASLPADNLADLVKLSKTKSGGLSYGTSGTGTSQHLCGELLKRATGIDMTHIPYKGAGPAMIDLASGQLSVVLVGTSTALPLNRTGRARVIAVTSAKRSPVLPEVPTLIEAGVPGFDIYHWIGVFGPTGMPQSIVQRWHAEIGRALATPAVRERLTSSGLDVAPSTPQELGALVREGIQRWSKLIGEAKLDLR